jgi:hypothetical protein
MATFYSKTKYISSLNGKLKKKLHIEMVKNNKGIHIVGYNNNKRINKTITFLKPNPYSINKPCNMARNNSIKVIKPKKNVKSKKRANTKKKKAKK